MQRDRGVRTHPEPTRIQIAKMQNPASPGLDVLLPCHRRLHRRCRRCSRRMACALLAPERHRVALAPAAAHLSLASTCTCICVHVDVGGDTHRKHPHSSHITSSHMPPPSPCWRNACMQNDLLCAVALLWVRLTPVVCLSLETALPRVAALPSSDARLAFGFEEANACRHAFCSCCICMRVRTHHAEEDKWRKGRAQTKGHMH